LQKELSETKVDLESYREENERLGKEIQDIRQKLMKIDTFMDVESIAFRLQSMEMENRSLNAQNSKLMEQLFKQKKENQRIKIVEEKLREEQNQVRNLDRANQLLLDRLRKLKNNGPMHSTGYRQDLLGQVEEGESVVRDLEDLNITANSQMQERVVKGGFYPKGNGILK
jgi:predicted  nucleic acid-binding Zn-ribbon protein